MRLQICSLEKKLTVINISGTFVYTSSKFFDPNTTKYVRTIERDQEIEHD